MNIYETYGISKKVVFKVECSNFENMIKNEIKKLFDFAQIDNYCFVADCEGNDDSVYSFHVKENQDKDYKYDDGIEKIKESHFYFSTNSLLAILAYHKVIEPGEYIVRVS